MGAAPGSAESAWLGEWLADLDGERWPVLLEELRAIARSLAPSYRDVSDVEDIVGELAILTWQRWMPRYREQLAQGRARASLRSFLTLRLRGHLHELRRKRRRREALASEALPSADRGADREAPEELREGDALFVGRTSEPEASLFADELVREVAADPKMRAVLALRYAGFSQDEIADMTEVSRPSISRRLAKIAALLTVLIATGLLGWWLSRPDLGVDRDGVGPPEPAPAVEPRLPPAPREDEGLSQEQIDRVVASERTSIERCYEESYHGMDEPHRVGGDLTVDISPAGRPTYTELKDASSRDFGACLVRAVGRWRFPSARAWTSTSLRLTAREDPLHQTSAGYRDAPATPDRSPAAVRRHGRQ